MANKKDSKKKDDKDDSAKKDGKKKSGKKDGKKKAEKKSDKKDSEKKGSKKKDSGKKDGKKDSGKKSSDKEGTKEARHRIKSDVISALDDESSDVEIISAKPSPRSVPRFEQSVISPVELSDRQDLTWSKKTSSRVALAVIVGVILIASFLIVRSHNNLTSPKSVMPSASPSVQPSTAPTSVMTPSPSASPTPAPSSPVASTSATSTTDLPPVGIIAYFNSTGATIVWKPDAKASGITGYKIEKSANGGVFKLIATVPATRHSFNVIEIDTDGWSSFRVSAVYSDGAVIAGKVFGIPSQYS